MKAFKTLLSGSALILLVIALAFSGCNTGQQNQTENTAADNLLEEVTLSPEAQELLNTFPSPYDVSNLLVQAKAGFIFDITNPPANVSNYNTEISQALNLGVYSADLTYSAAFNRDDEAGKFIASASKLAENLGLSGHFDQQLYDKVKKYGNQRDSLELILKDLFTSTTQTLSRDNRTRVAVLVVCGAFAEALYLSATLAEVAKDNTQITAIIAGQNEHFLKLLTILEAYGADPQMRDVADRIGSLKPIWGNYNIESGKKLELSKAAEISDIAEEVRNAFVK